MLTIMKQSEIDKIYKYLDISKNIKTLRKNKLSFKIIFGNNNKFMFESMLNQNRNID